VLDPNFSGLKRGLAVEFVRTFLQDSVSFWNDEIIMGVPEWGTSRSAVAD
jgi:hypothetical protein